MDEVYLFFMLAYLINFAYCFGRSLAFAQFHFPLIAKDSFESDVVFSIFMGITNPVSIFPLIIILENCGLLFREPNSFERENAVANRYGSKMLEIYRRKLKES